MKPTLDDVLSAAEQAKVWRPTPPCTSCQRGSCLTGKLIYDAEDDDGFYVSVPVNGPWCASCQGAQRAMEDVAEWVRLAMRFVNLFTASTRATGADSWAQAALGNAHNAARIESYFGAPGPVAEFDRIVMEFCA